MSVKAMALAWELDLKPAKKYILLAYVDHADHNGSNIYPSIGLVAWKTGYTVRQVQLVAKELVEVDKLLIPEGIYKNSVKRYRFDFEQAEKLKMPAYRSKDILSGDELDSSLENQGVNVIRSGDELDSPLEAQGMNVVRSRDESDSPDPLRNHHKILTISDPSDGASAQPPADPEFLPSEKKGKSEKDPSLQIQSTPSGRVLWAELEYSARAEGRRPPAAYESVQQRDGFLAVYESLNGELQALIKKGMSRGRKSRADLLAWLEGCAAKRKKPKGEQSPPTANPYGAMTLEQRAAATGEDLEKLKKARFQF